MTTLKELIDNQELTGMSDVQIITSFFTLNDMEEEGMDLIQELTRSKIKKMKQKHKLAEEWASCLPSKYLYENYDLDTAYKLHNLEIDFLVNGGELSDGFLFWASENIPKIAQPMAYFNPLVDWLNDKGIRFKERGSEKDADTEINIENETER